MATIQDIKQRAQQVKDATQIGENTANRVGGVLVDMADHLEQDENDLSSLLPMDEVPTPNSVKPVKSGGVSEFVFNSISIRDAGVTKIIATTGVNIAQIGSSYFVQACQSDGWRTRYTKVSKGDVYSLTVTRRTSSTFTLGFCPDEPIIGTEITNIEIQTGKEVTFNVVAPYDGYVVWAGYTNSNTDPASYSGTLSTSVKKEVEHNRSAIEVLEYAEGGLSPMLHGAKVSIMGNSICTFAGYVPSGNRTQYPNNDVQSVADTWWWQFIKTMGASLDLNNSYSAGRVTNTHETYPSYLDRYRSIGIGTPDLLILWGGINDMRNGTVCGSPRFEIGYDDIAMLDESIFAEAWQKLVLMVMHDHPDCKIVSICEPYLDEEYRAVIVDVAQNYGLYACVDLSQKGEQIKRYDSLHPTAEGMKYICNDILLRLTDVSDVRRDITEVELGNYAEMLKLSGLFSEDYVEFTGDSSAGATESITMPNVYRAGRPLLIEVGGYTSTSTAFQNVFLIQWQPLDGAEKLDILRVPNDGSVVVPKTILYTPEVDGQVYVWCAMSPKNKRLHVRVSEPFATSEELQEIVMLNSLRNTMGNGQKGRYEYQGSRVSLKKFEPAKYRYGINTLNCAGAGSYQGNAAQGFTYWNGIGFAFYDGGYCQVVDFSDESNVEVVNAFALPSPVCNPNNHAGQANWGEFYDQNDDFPLLYLSSYLEKCCYVLRMTREGATLIQTLYLTDGTLTDGHSTKLDAQAWFCDGERIIVKMGAQDRTGYAYKYWKVFNMPYFGWGTDGVFYLEDAQKIDEFYLRTIPNQYQGTKNYVNAGFAQDGKIFVLAGFDGAQQRLMVIDYNNHAVISDVVWGATSMRSVEQEQCCRMSDNQMLINYNGADKFVKVTFA